MDIAGRLARIQGEMVEVDNEKQQRQYNLGLFWEHMPCADPVIVEDRISFLKNRIKYLEDRKKVLLQQQAELLVTVALLRQPATTEEEKEEKEEEEEEKEEEEEGEKQEEETGRS